MVHKVNKAAYYKIIYSGNFSYSWFKSPFSISRNIKITSSRRIKQVIADEAHQQFADTQYTISASIPVSVLGLGKASTSKEAIFFKTDIMTDSICDIHGQ